MSLTSIEWTDRTWNPTRGCSRVSEGCRHCYAERMAARFVTPNRETSRGVFAGPFFGVITNGKWNGRVELITEKLTEPLSWRKPSRVFVNSMSDLFHEALPAQDIAEVFRVMARCPQHTFQILTKRPERIAELVPRMLATFGSFPNVWLGVSVEDQATADKRIPLLLQTPAAKRFVSYEPALGPVEFRLAAMDWVIVGGESGPGARPFDLEWARGTVRWGKAVGVPVFVKQLGRWVKLPASEDLKRPFGCRPDRYLHVDGGTFVPGFIGAHTHDGARGAIAFSLDDAKGGDPSEWPEDLRVREFPA